MVIMAEEYEAIVRQITVLEDRVKSAKDRIAYLREEEKMLRTEYEVSPVAKKYMVMAMLRSTWGSIGAYTRWSRYWEKLIEELKKLLPPFKYIRLITTFSVETGEGHEPFFAEVTCDTVIPVAADRGVVQYRLVNAVIKLFWVLFDIQKSLKDLELAGYKGTPAYDWLVRHKEIIQKHAVPPAIIREKILDELIKKIRELGALSRDPEEYVTTQAIIKIGVEYFYADEKSTPRYPTVDVVIEKSKREGEPPTWIIERTLVVLLPETDVNILRILGIMLE